MQLVIAYLVIIGKLICCTATYWNVIYKISFQDLDERALDALKEFPVEGAVTVLKQFLESNLEHVSNKSAYLCGVMKTYRQRKQYNSEYSILFHLVKFSKIIDTMLTILKIILFNFFFY